MAEPTGPSTPEAARARARALATEALEAGRPTAWFERLYRAAAGDPAGVPWADLVPNPALAAWAARPGALAGARTACVVGCGLGHDAEHLARLGLRVTAFDVAPEAIAWAQRLHPRTTVVYEVADLFALPAAWRAAFDLVVEVYTLQALPRAVRGAAARAVRSLVAPGGRILLYTRVREDGPVDERAEGPPWPLGRGELTALFAPFEPEAPWTEERSEQDPRVTRVFGVLRAPSR
ncbi:MAG TPA: class I SAM-dependent methyltransferase [Planctomycetota bacterium]|nr:class I SAM-dependent methyltransferase [Planctomycetota bacterium]